MSKLFLYIDSYKGTERKGRRKGRGVINRIEKGKEKIKLSFARCEFTTERNRTRRSDSKGTEFEAKGRKKDGARRNKVE